MDRRKLLWPTLPVVIGAGVAGRVGSALTVPPNVSQEKLSDLEKRSGGRLGVAALDTATGRRIGHRADERFPMCSTFKILAVGALLARVDHGKEHLDRLIYFTKKDLVTYSPVTEKRIETGMSLRELCDAGMRFSDNTAANLILDAIGGPPAVTAFARSLDDTVTRLERSETELNEAAPGDPRDTTAPAAMLSDLRKLALGDTLSKESRALLIDWMVRNTTGDARIRAGLPSTWKVGDKTGSGDHGTANDVAIAWPPGRAPILIAAYLTGAMEDGDQRSAIVAAAGKIVADSL